MIYGDSIPPANRIFKPKSGFSQKMWGKPRKRAEIGGMRT
jgi:hypothetical protein